LLKFNRWFLIILELLPIKFISNDLLKPSGVDLMSILSQKKPSPLLKILSLEIMFNFCVKSLY